MLRSCLLKSRYFIATMFALVSLTGTMTLLTCTKDNPVEVQEPTWNFTIDVLNGYTGNKISGASVQYMTKDQKDTVVATNSDGRVKISNLAAGTQSFQVYFTGADTATKFTSVVIEGTSILDQNDVTIGDLNLTNAAGKKVLADKAQTVKLFPLTGSFSGRVVTQVNAMAAKVPVANVVVSAMYDNADLASASNKAMQVKTDSTGAFSFTGLPVATGLKVTINAIPVSNVDYVPETFEVPVLVSGITVPMGTIIMKPIDADNFSMLGSVPSVIAPNDSIKLTFSDVLDTLSTVKLEGTGGATGSQNVAVMVKFKGATMTIIPSVSLVDGNSYKLVINAYGKTGGAVTSTNNITVKGGGIIDVIGSNVLDANHLAQDGLGLSDSMEFIFRADVDNASASVKNGNKVVLVDVVVSESSVIIKPKGNWESATYTVRVSANLSDGTASTFTVVISTVGALEFVSSNVYNPTTNAAISGIGFKDTITFVANKTIVSAKATLLLGSVAIPFTIAPISGATVKIIPNDFMRPATQYTLTLTVATAEGETKSTPALAFTTASSDFFPLVDNIRFDNDPTKPVLNFPPNGTIFIKMSDTVKSATAQLNPSAVSVNVTVSADSIKITPVGNLTEGTAYNLVVSAESKTGTVINGPFVTGFYVQQNKVFVVASNVMNVNGIGLTNVPVTGNPYFVLSATPVEASLAVSIGKFTAPATVTLVDAVVTLSGDTIKVKPVKNLDPKAVYQITIKGKTTSNANIDIKTDGDAAFTTQEGAFVVATNMKDAQGNDASNLAPTTELWVKFSRTLSTDLTKQELGGGTGTPVTYSYGTPSANNATIRVSGDTLFAKFMTNALPAYGATVTLTAIKVLFNDASTIGSSTVDFTATIAKKATPYVVATNGIKSNTVVDTFGVLSEVWVVSSLPLKSVDAVKNVTAMVGGLAGNLVISNVRTNGDTIFFKPSIRLGYDASYKVYFEVTLASDSSKYTGNDLSASWKTQKDLFIATANDLSSDKKTYRPFSVVGDTLILTFTKPVDTTKAVSLSGFVTKKTFVWTSKQRLLVIPVDTLNAKAYDPNPDYTATGTAQYSGLVLTLTAEDGKAWGNTLNAAAFDNARPDLAIHTVPGLAILNSNLVVSSVDKTKLYVNATNRKIADLVADGLIAANDSVGTGDTLKVYFSSAVDSVTLAANFAMVQLKLGSLVQNVTMWYGNNRKTLFVKSANALTAGASYDLILTNVKANGLLNADANAKVTKTFAFTVRPVVGKPVSQTVIALSADTAFTATVQGKRRGYSGSDNDNYGQAAGPASLNTGDVPSVNNISLRWYEAGFRSTAVADTVSHYQFAVRGNGSTWYYLQGLKAAAHYNPFSPNADSIIRYDLDLSGVVNDINGFDVGTTLRTIAGVSARQEANIFNNGTVVQVMVRPVVSANALWDAADKSGNWSNVISVQDNIAPCDSDYVANPGTVPGLVNDVSRGGVSATASTVVTLVRTAAPNNGTGLYVYTLVFPEDMDTTSTNKPSISFYYGVTAGLPSTTFSVNSNESYWTDKYTYRLAVSIPGAYDWTANVPYYAISIAGMKDASGQAIQSWGSVGTAANGTLIGAVTSPVQGTVNLNGLTAY